MDLSIGSVSAYEQAQTLGQVQTAVDVKILNIAKEQGAAALQLVQAAMGASGGAGDSLAAKATGLGGQIDTYG